LGGVDYPLLSDEAKSASRAAKCWTKKEVIAAAFIVTPTAEISDRRQPAMSAATSKKPCVS
jgi:hypothetical protein